MLDWMVEKLGVKDTKELGNVVMNRKRWREIAPP